jgi:type IV secretory pathway VirB6-like protein
MYYGRAGFGIVFVVFHLLAAGAFLYLMYNISKSLKRIADTLEKKSPPAIEGKQPQQIIE